MEFMLENDQDEQNSTTGVYKVMTDEQIEILRKQISVYSTLSQQLVEMHNQQQQQQHLLLATTTTDGGIFYSDPSVALGHRITARQRWTPTPVQLQVLEQIFDQGNGTPTKQKIKEIADDLSKHGLISETNVYNWFQNRRARSKRKQLASSNNEQQPDHLEEADSTTTSKQNNNNTKPEMIMNTQHSSSSFQNMNMNMVVHTDESLYYDGGTEMHNNHLFSLEEEHHHLSSSYESSLPESKLCFYQPGPGDQFHMLDRETPSESF